MDRTAQQALAAHPRTFEPATLLVPTVSGAWREGSRSHAPVGPCGQDHGREDGAPKSPKKERKDKWLFIKRGEPWLGIAGIWRSTPDVGEAFTMLTMAPGPDIEPYHDRHIVILDRAHWADWLDPSVPARSVLKPLPAGTLVVEQVG